MGNAIFSFAIRLSLVTSIVASANSVDTSNAQHGRQIEANSDARQTGLCAEADSRLRPYLCSRGGVLSLADTVTRCLFDRYPVDRCKTSDPLPDDPAELLTTLVEASRKSTAFKSDFGKAMNYRAQRRFSSLRHCRVRRGLGIGCGKRTEKFYNGQIGTFDTLALHFPLIPKETRNLLVLASATARCHLDFDRQDKPECQTFFDPFSPEEFVTRANQKFPGFEKQYQMLLSERLRNLAGRIATSVSAIELGSRNPYKKIADRSAVASEMKRFGRFGGFETYRTAFEKARERSYEFHVRTLARCEVEARAGIYKCSDEDRGIRTEALRKILSEFPEMESIYTEALLHRAD